MYLRGGEGKGGGNRGREKRRGKGRRRRIPLSAFSVISVQKMMVSLNKKTL